VIGAFVVLACAATLHVAGTSIDDAGDAAAALKPLAGGSATFLFGAGLLGAALLAASILPLATAYSVSEALGYDGGLDDSFSEARTFYCTYGALVALGAGIVLIPGVPLVPILFLTQALNAILLPPLLIFMTRIARDPLVMGRQRSGTAATVAYNVTIAVVIACVAALAVLALG
jgi:Mn2+/Fe2+ NRAMP family transporter